MDGPKAPKNYTPEHCNWVQASLVNTLQSAIDTLALISKGQDELTAQTIASLSKSLGDIITDIEDLQNRLANFKLWIYGGAVTGLLLLISGLFKFLPLLKGLPIK